MEIKPRAVRDTNARKLAQSRVSTISPILCTSQTVCSCRSVARSLARKVLFQNIGMRGVNSLVIVLLCASNLESKPLVEVNSLFVIELHMAVRMKEYRTVGIQLKLTNGMCDCVGDNLLRVGRGYEMNHTCENACIEPLNRHGLVEEVIPLRQTTQGG